MKRLFIALVLAVNPALYVVLAQSYTSYITGSSFDRRTTPEGGICMMGGATEHDEAMRWFLTRADSGDVLVLRASGSDGYNNYMYSELGVRVNSVETIVFNNASAANEPYIHFKIRGAEAIWFAGGDQWDYVSYWRDTMIDSLINEAIVNRNIVIGGTSAGMAILGKYYFTSQNGTITSPEALSNPFNPLVTVDSTRFLDLEFMRDVVTDSHYDARERQGRHVVFLARILNDYGMFPKGIACNEYTAVCVDEAGLARVYGDYPAYEEAAYFLQTNCELGDPFPETCAPAQPLNWNQGGAAIRVCKVYGTDLGSNTFDLTDWETSVNGIWENWYVDNGVLIDSPGVQIDCNGSAIEDEVSLMPININLVGAFPNPFNPSTTIRFELPFASHVKLTTYDIMGREMARLADGQLSAGTHDVNWDCSSFASGVYLIELKGNDFHEVVKAMLLR